MTSDAPPSVATALARPGILFFPITPFDIDGQVDPDVLATHVGSRLDHAPAAVFAACGTGEFHALEVDEVGTVASTVTKVVQGRVPVVIGCGGPLGHARRVAAVAEAGGADALLLMPPYLVSGPPAGMLDWIDAVGASTDLPLMVYDRGTARLDPDTVAAVCTRPQVIGLKDGRGDVAALQDVVRIVHESGRRDFLLFNGLPTAEMSQAACRAVGVERYSSAVFAMAPDIATTYYAAQDDEPRRTALVDAFYRPLVHLRDQVPGYGVSLIKAGVGLGGLGVGSVRPPLVDPTSDHVQRLEQVLASGRRAAAVS